MDPKVRKRRPKEESIPCEEQVQWVARAFKRGQIHCMALR